MALIKFVLILFVIFFLIRVFARYVLRSYVKNMQRNFNDRQNQQSQKKEGDVTINTKPQKEKKIDRDEGDYVDYEEIE
jgi:archaellum component FlaG (FlaF/FlaG flagellin family)